MKNSSRHICRHRLCHSNVGEDDTVLSAYTVLVPMDVNGDGKITAQDVRVALRVAARLESPNSVSQRAADIDADGKITASDARGILRKTAHLE